MRLYALIPLMFILMFAMIVSPAIPTTNSMTASVTSTTDGAHDGSMEVMYNDGAFLGYHDAGFTSAAVALEIPDGIVNHSKIAINGDDAFEDQAASEGWPGSGTEADPFIISDYLFSSVGGEAAIDIENVSLVFTIRDCVFIATNPAESVPDVAVGLKYVDSALIQNITTSHHIMGVGIIEGGNISVMNCTMQICDFAGLWVQGIENIELSGNQIKVASFGAMIHGDGGDAVINDNDFDMIEFMAIEAEGVGATIERNSCIDAALFIPFDGLDGIVITDDNLVNGYPYFLLNDTDMNGTAIPSTGYGQYALFNVTNVIAEDIAIERMAYDIYMIECHDVEVRDCTFSGTKIGLSFYQCSGVYAHDNTFSQNIIAIGLYTASDNSIITDNVIHSESDGLYLESIGNEVRGNTIYDVEVGMNVLGAANDNVIIGNNMSYCANAAMIIYGSNNTMLANTFYRNSGNSPGEEFRPEVLCNGTGNVWNTEDLPHGYGNYWACFDGPSDSGIFDDPIPMNGGEGCADHCGLTMKPSAPGAPWHLTAYMGADGIILDWMPTSYEHGSKVTSYNVYRATASTGWVKIGETSDTKYVDTTIRDGLYYIFTYKVTAVNLLGEGTPSDPVTYEAPSDMGEDAFLTAVGVIVLLIAIGVVYSSVRKRRKG